MEETQPQNNEPTVPLTNDEKEIVSKVVNRKKTGRPPKDFPAILRAAVKVLKRTGLTHDQIATQLNIPVARVSQTLRFHSEIDHDQVEKLTGEFSQQIAEIVMKLLSRTNDQDVIDKVPLTVLSTMIGTMMDKYLLLKGKATSISEARNTQSEVEQKLKELDELEKLLQKPKDSQSN